MAARNCRPGNECVAALHDLDGDGVDEVLLANSWVVTVFRTDATGQWSEIGSYGPFTCEPNAGDARPPLREGLRFRTPTYPTVEVEGRLFHFNQEDCIP
jgi:hypothetical protein